MEASSGPATVAAPEPESGFALSDASQSLTTRGRTELLIGGAWCGEEEDVTAGPVARQAGDFFGDFGWALTHGGGGDVRGWLAGQRWLGVDGGRRRVAGGGVVRVGERGSLAAALARASGLVAAMVLAVWGRPIALPGHPAAPASRGGLAGRATVTSLGPARQEPTFTPLEQAATAAGVPSARRGWLTRHQCLGKLETAHGRSRSRAVRRREGDTSRRPFAPTAWTAVVGNRTARTLQITCTDSCLPSQEGWAGRKGAKAAIDRSRNGSTGSAKVAHFLTAADTWACSPC